MRCHLFERTTISCKSQTQIIRNSTYTITDVKFNEITERQLIYVLYKSLYIHSKHRDLPLNVDFDSNYTHLVFRVIKLCDHMQQRLFILSIHDIISPCSFILDLALDQT